MYIRKTASEECYVLAVLKTEKRENFINKISMMFNKITFGATANPRLNLHEASDEKSL